MLTFYGWHILGSVLCIVIILQQWTIQMAIQDIRMDVHIVPQVVTQVVTKVVTATPTTVDAATTEVTIEALSEFDERLMSHVRSILVKPNNRSVPYALQNPNAADYSQDNTGPFVLSLLKNKTKGFFFECGAFDGETFSNSLALEKFFNWTGLLVEGSPKNVQVMLTKKRRAWISPTCLSTTRKSMKVKFLDSTNTGKIVGGANQTVAKPQSGSLVQSFCVPFNTLMKVLDIKHIDYLTLDVEGQEFEILQTIDFNSVTIDVMAVEFNNFRPPEILQEILKIANANGFVMVKRTRLDYIFVHTRIYQPPIATSSNLPTVNPTTKKTQ
ncbi:uncharacterized protein LOC132194017 [Neocloeon triangulifer]|uniref:uncharacterized protein LOC132194017 n=1 Tax=Neocloeon triangulifer TaxID=2078957 RepID=UPI00286FA3AA|nr:uncharacterized protein LOC132194017 [Neocloeon triangulifer]